MDAIWTARSELVRSLTVPRRKISPFSDETRIGCPAVRSAARDEVLPSGRSPCERWPNDDVEELPAAALLPKRSGWFLRGFCRSPLFLVGLTAVASAKSPSPTAIRSIGLAYRRGRTSRRRRTDRSRVLATPEAARRDRAGPEPERQSAQMIKEPCTETSDRNGGSRSHCFFPSSATNFSSLRLEPLNTSTR